MSRFIEATIENYKIALDPDMEGATPGQPKVTGCWIELRKNGNTYLGSLGLLQDIGHLECDKTRDPHVVPEETIDQIAVWAEANGY